MIPILLSGTTVKGFLADAMTCVVTEERNGIYEMSLTYPVTGALFSELAVDRFIKAKPNDKADLQLFRIYEITKPLNGIVTVNAEHISYMLSHYPVSNISVTGNAALVINTILSNANSNLAAAHDFTVATTGLSASKKYEYAIGSVRSALGGSDGSVLDVFGGEYEFDNYVIRLHQHRGTDTGVIVAYGKNLTDIEVDTSMENSYTHLFPYCKDDEENIVMITNRLIAVTNGSGIEQRVLIKDFTSFFGEGEAKNAANLLSKANAWLTNNDINAPSVHVKVSFVHLWQSPEYKNVAALEKVSLCDYVTVRHQTLGVDIKAQVIKTVYNTLSERYESIELGSAKANFADTLQQATDKLQEAIDLMKTVDNTSAITAAYMAAIDSATKAITGYSGGYVVLNPSLNPQELLVMNTVDKNTATKLWRWNVGGLGYSKNGYNGPFTTAITMNGQIVADFITTGTLTANIIRAGILSSALGDSYFNLESGLIHTANAEIVGGSISIGGGTYKTVIEDGSIKQYLTSATKPLGGMVPIGTSAGAYEAIYVSNQSNAKGVSLAYQNSDGSFTTVGEFGKSSVYINKTTYFLYNIQTNLDYGNRFAGITHYRTTNFNSGSSAYTALCALGCGVARNKPTAAMEIRCYGSDTVESRLDVYASDGEAMICLRGNRWGTVSNELELGKHIWFAGEMNAKKFNASSVEEIKENVVPCGSALNVLKSATVYQYNLIPEPTVTVQGEIIDEVESENAIAPESNEVTELGNEENVVTKDSVGFIINEDTPEILLSEDGKHIDLYTAISLNWKATQEILQRLEALEGEV
ncbi:MAG: phage tail protein [Clostridiales bacterium]|nr:phage tail protein [Clostridiales bacterium]